jgi:hypothetical protein
MQMWSMHDITTKEQARKNSGRPNNGKNAEVEDTATADDAWDVLIRLAGSGVVYDIARPYVTASSTCKCRDRGHDRCLCGMDGT